MHSQVQSKKPGVCLLCGMQLVLQKDRAEKLTKQEKGDYTPLVVILLLITLASIVISWHGEFFSKVFLREVVFNFMTGFFLVFAGFKLMDMHGFAEGYKTYDLLAQKWNPYGYIYPFIELFFGLAMLAGFVPPVVFILEIIVMTFSGIGVLTKIVKKEKFQCACLGTFLKVPLTKVTLIEDFGMVILAFFMLFF